MSVPRGFTLVETAVALAVTAVVLLALATAIPTTLRTTAAATGRLEQTTAARGFLLHLERELATALAEPFVLTARPTPRLAFTGGPEPGQRLAYAVEHGAIVRRATPRFAAANLPTPGVPLLHHVDAFALDAFDGRDWIAAWDAGTPPAAVRVRIRFADGETFGVVAAIPTARRRAP
jgi:prepilin-type N-terminal cleavage/methylation domain-containing protein